MDVSRLGTFLGCVTVLLAWPIKTNQASISVNKRSLQWQTHHQNGSHHQRNKTVLPWLYSKPSRQNFREQSGYRRSPNMHAVISAGLPDNESEKNSNAFCVRDVEAAVRAFEYKETWALRSKLTYSSVPARIDILGFTRKFNLQYCLNTEIRGPHEISGHNIIDLFPYRDPWTFQMYDAMGKVGSGVMDRQLRYWGDYTQCLRTKVNLTFHTTYCMAYLLAWKMEDFQWTKPRRVELGLCVPSSCNSSSVTNLLNLYLFKKQGVTAKAMSSKCQERSLSLTSGAIVAIFLCSTIALLMLLGTAYDVIRLKGLQFTCHKYVQTNENKDLSNQCEEDYSSTGNSDQVPVLVTTKRKCKPLLAENRKAETASQFLLSFSVVANGSKLLSTFTHQTELQCLNGIRVLSMVGIILGHTMANVVKPCDNGYDDLMRITKQQSYEMNAAYMFVDTFFVLSGLLVVYSTMPRIKARGINLRFVTNMYVLRYLRLTPAYFLVLFTYTQLFKYLADGPMWPQDGLDLDRCDQFPWNNLLYINNYVSVGPSCMDWSWYLAVDMQFFLISPFILLALYYFDHKGLLVLVCLTVASTVAAGVVSYNNKLEPVATPIQSAKAINDYMSLYYFKPYMRYGPYAAGMALGFFLEKSRCSAHLSKRTVALGWASSVLTLLFVTFCIYFHENYGPMGTEVAAIYNALHRTAWGLAVCWMIYACATGYGGPVNTLLSSTVFSWCSKITYMVYLIHLLVINYYALSAKQTTYVDGNITVVNNGIYHLMSFCFLSYILAFGLSLAFEAPFVNLLKLLRQRHGKNLQSIEESRM